MSAFTVIKLDTTPPVITWGPVTNAIASEEMTVLYLLDEPLVTDASFELLDGRVLVCTVAEDRITVQIPDDAPEGIGVLTASLCDDVGNVDTATLDIYVTGMLEPLPPPVPPLLQLPAEEPWRTRSRCITRSRYSILATRRLPSRATIRSRTRIVWRPAQSPPASVTVRSSVRVRAHLTGSSRLQSGERWTLAKSPEGPKAEAEALLLWLL